MDVEITPPDGGKPFTSFNLAVCKASAPTDCWTQAGCPANNANPKTTCTISSPVCLAGDARCLLAETAYTVTVVGVNQAGDTTLPSSPEPFATPSHR